MGRKLLAISLALVLAAAFGTHAGALGLFATTPPLTLPETIEVLEGRTVHLTEVAYADDAQLSLSKKAEKVVTLENGVLTPVKPGKAVLSAVRGGETAQATVRVFSQKEAAKEVLALVNAARKAEGLKALKLSDGLNDVAEARAAELPALFSHDRPDGRKFDTAYTELKVKFGYKGENIAAGQFGPAQVTRDWLGLPGHRANILYPKFTHMGAAYFISESGTVCWVQVFGG